MTMMTCWRVGGFAPTRRTLQWHKRHTHISFTLHAIENDDVSVGPLFTFVLANRDRVFVGSCVCATPSSSSVQHFFYHTERVLPRQRVVRDGSACVPHSLQTTVALLCSALLSTRAHERRILATNKQVQRTTRFEYAWLTIQSRKWLSDKATTLICIFSQL